MNKKEKDTQKALGLLKRWDVYVRFGKDSYYTIYEEEALTREEASIQTQEKIKKYLCKIESVLIIKRKQNYKICFIAEFGNSIPDTGIYGHVRVKLDDI